MQKERPECGDTVISRLQVSDKKVEKVVTRLGLLQSETYPEDVQTWSSINE
jgi:hypothetical protein